MGMEISKTFVVKAPVDAVWAFLTDPYKVARCLPGAAMTEKIDEQNYAGTMTVKVGPVTASYRGKLRFDRLDPAAHEAELVASGQETRGKGGADMRMRSKIVERGPAESEVSVVSDVNVVGVLAQFGRGMIQDVSDQMFQKFSDAMRRELEPAAAPAEAAAPVTPAAAVSAATPAAAAAPPVVGPAAASAAATPAATPPSAPPPPAPVAAPVAAAEENVLDVGALGAQAAGRAALRTLRRPVFWVAVVILILLVFWLSHR